MKKHLDLRQKALDAVIKVATDTNVPAMTNRESLEQIKEEIELRLSVLRKD